MLKNSSVVVNEKDYEEYMGSLLNIARLTNKENSVLISFVVEDDKCSNVVNFIQQDGTRDELKNSTFKYDEKFCKEFLEKLVVTYYKNMNVILTDSIDMNEDGKYTYRIITEDNDMLSIHDISFEYANYLVSLVKNETTTSIQTDSGVINENGVATAVISLILVGGIGLSFLIFSLLLS